MNLTAGGSLFLFLSLIDVVHHGFVAEFGSNYCQQLEIIHEIQQKNYIVSINPLTSSLMRSLILGNRSIYQSISVVK